MCVGGGVPEAKAQAYQPWWQLRGCQFEHTETSCRSIVNELLREVFIAFNMKRSKSQGDVKDVFKMNPTLPIATAPTKAPMILLGSYVDLSVASVCIIICSIHIVCTKIFPTQFLITTMSSL